MSQTHLEPTRPWPAPTRWAALAMRWHDLLFAHWAVDPEQLRPHIPACFELDTFDGQAYIGLVPFVMSGVRPRPLPSLPWLSAFPEFNVRTYVTLNDKPGVWFYTLDATNPVAVRVARTTYGLPYCDATISAVWQPDGWLAYNVQRTHKGLSPGRFSARYRPTGGTASYEPGSLDRWLTERYCLYVADRRGRPWRGEIDHEPWPLEPAEVEGLSYADILPPGVNLPDEPPLLHFARRLDVIAWTLKQA